MTARYRSRRNSDSSCDVVVLAEIDHGRCYVVVGYVEMSNAPWVMSSVEFFDLFRAVES